MIECQQVNKEIYRLNNKKVKGIKMKKLMIIALLTVISAPAFAKFVCYIDGQKKTVNSLQEAQKKYPGKECDEL